MKSKVSKLTVAIASSLMIVALAFANDGSCWKPARTLCPEGVSNENGKQCSVGCVIVVSDETERTQEQFCDGHSNNCQNKGRECNIRRTKDALWRKVYCDCGSQGRTFVGWCMDAEYGNTNTNVDCSGVKCKPVAEPGDPPIEM